MAWMEHGLLLSLKRYALSMEDKMAAGTLGALRIMGETVIVNKLHRKNVVSIWSVRGR